MTNKKYFISLVLLIFFSISNVLLSLFANNILFWMKLSLSVIINIFFILLSVHFIPKYKEELNYEKKQIEIEKKAFDQKKESFKLGMKQLEKILSMLDSRYFDDKIFLETFSKMRLYLDQFLDINISLNNYTIIVFNNIDYTFTILKGLGKFLVKFKKRDSEMKEITKKSLDEFRNDLIQFIQDEYGIT